MAIVENSVEVTTAGADVDWRRLITPELSERYRRDGVVFVPQLIHPEWLDLIAAGIRRILNNSNPNKQRFFQDLDGEFLDTVRNVDVTPEFQRLLFDSPIADMISALLGSEKIWLLFDHVFVKDRGECRRTPWHQDLPYWPVDGDMLASMWITLDAIPKEECLEFVPGSHRRTIYDGFNPQLAAEDLTAPFYGERFPRLPDIERERDQWEIVSWDITPGDVVLIHPGVLHGGGQTSQGRSRRTLSVRCFGDDVVYSERPPTRPTVPKTPGLRLKLKPGDPLRHPYYPRLRPLPPSQHPDKYS
jgi:ectoine hydroxylase-related dioxygenase (phytanoyl-CoA dioxygenase family)